MSGGCHLNNPLSAYLFLTRVLPLQDASCWLIVTEHEFDALDLAGDIETLSATLTGSALSVAALPDEDHAVRNLRLDALAAGDLRCLVMSAHALAQPVATAEALKASTILLNAGAVFARESLLPSLVSAGFKRVDLVESKGEFAVRGQVVDIFATTCDDPVRILFNGDEVESIKTYDIISQESLAARQSLRVIAVGSGSGSTLYDHVLAPISIVLANPLLAVDSAPAQGVWTFASARADALTAEVTANQVYSGNLTIFASQARSALDDGYRIIVVAPTSGDEERTREILWQDMQDGRSVLARAAFMHGRLTGGFKDSERKIWVVTTGELFARVKVKISGIPQAALQAANRPGGKVFSVDLLELKIGDIVVHESYGIACYRGIETAYGMDGAAHGEFLKLEFAKRDKLFVPVEDFHLLHRYASVKSAQAPRLSSLDAKSFAAVKGRVREEIQKFCNEMLAVLAKRQAQSGLAMQEASTWEKEFAASFPYEETADQQRVIDEVLSDMASPRPMERLLLGDVGFGKTEVAMRAAMRAVANGKQAVLVAPTTVLAEQHFRKWCERFAPYPVTLALFSRFSKPKQIKDGIKALKKGHIDIAIGTHRLLQKDIGFKNLGLLVLDEEHRFGVKDKERLKFMCSQVDTLYMSATPIPRTLSSAFSGMRAISIIETAPVGRLPIETHLGAWDRDTVSRAIRYEVGRGGQVFYVYNDIRKLPQIAKELRELIPGVRTATCHGQMNGASIEEVMHKFLNREFDILVASSIIESGLDIATVNTLIIEEAQDFGIAQLYQLRGRIGRSSQHAYAYFFYPRDQRWQDLSAQAKERLDAIREFVDLGCAMRLAMRDLEIRGAGDILGVRQHGFVSKIGLELFTKLLSEEVEKVKEGSATRADEDAAAQAFPKVTIAEPALLPVTYVPSETERVAYYRRLGRTTTLAEIDSIFDEIVDRCGPLPQEVKHLVTFFKLRLRGKRAGLSVIEQSRPDAYRFEIGARELPRGDMVAFLLSEFGPRVRFEHAKQAFEISGISDAVAALAVVERFSKTTT
ncbi:MAG: DEAD/DEAH box helicase [Elusimicrobiota bacterium]